MCARLGFSRFECPCLGRCAIHSSRVRFVRDVVMGCLLHRGPLGSVLSVAKVEKAGHTHLHRSRPPPGQPIPALSQPEQLGSRFSPGPLGHLLPLSFCLGQERSSFLPRGQKTGRPRSKTCLWLPAAGSFSSAGERGQVVFIIGFLSACGPGALSKIPAAAGRVARGALVWRLAG